MQAIDQYGLSASTQVKVYTNDVNDAPVLLDGEVRAVKENSLRGTRLTMPTSRTSATRLDGVVCGTDDDSTLLTFAIVGGTGAGLFALEAAGSSLCTYIVVDAGSANATNYESGVRTYTLHLRATDNGSPQQSATSEIAIMVEDDNDVPVFINGNNVVLEVAEDARQNSRVGAPIIATDEDVGATLTYTIESGNTGSVFAISSTGNIGQLTVASSDLRGANSGQREYDLQIMASDGGSGPGHSAIQRVIVRLINQNSPPVIECSNLRVAETTRAGLTVGKVNAFDPNGDAVAFELTAQAPNDGSFACSDDGTISVVTDNLDAGKMATHYLYVQVNERPYRAGQLGLSDTCVMAVTVTDANDPPVLADTTLFVPENLPVGGYVGQQITATDKDTQAAFRENWYYIVGGNVGNRFGIHKQTGQLFLQSGALDFETQKHYRLKVRVADRGNERVTETISGITCQAWDVQTPNAHQRSTYSTAAGDNYCKALPGGPTGSANAPWCYLSTGQGKEACVDKSDEAFVDINVQDVREAPVLPANTVRFINENAAAGARVGGRITFTDDDASGDHEFRIVSGDPSRIFAIDNNGQLYVTRDGELDFEEMRTNAANSGVQVAIVDPTSGSTATSTAASAGTFVSVTLTISVNDENNAQLISHGMVTVYVMDVNERPVFDEASTQPKLIAENSVVGTLVGTPVTATDDDMGQDVTYTIEQIGARESIFGIDSSTGQIYVAKDVLDYEGQHLYGLRIIASDGGGSVSAVASATTALASAALAAAGGPGPAASTAIAGSLSSDTVVLIRVIDVNEAPVAHYDGAQFLVREDAVAGTKVGALLASDVDDGQTLSFAITAATCDRCRVTIHGSAAASGSASWATEDVGVWVNLAMQMQGRSVAIEVEGAGCTAILATGQNGAGATSSVIGVGRTALSGSLVNGVKSVRTTCAAMSAFNVVGNEIVVASALNYEAQSGYVLDIEVADNDATSSLKSVGKVFIDVTDVNEAPSLTEANPTRSVAETAAVGEEFGLPINATDPDESTSFHFEIVSGDPTGRFAIESCSGQLRVAEPLDYETQGEFTLRIRVSDGGGMFSETNIIVRVEDEMEAPTFRSPVFAFDVAENSNAGTVAGSVLAASISGDSSSISYKLIDEYSRPYTEYKDMQVVSASTILNISTALDADACKVICDSDLGEWCKGFNFNAVDEQCEFHMLQLSSSSQNVLKKGTYPGRGQSYFERSLPDHDGVFAVDTATGSVTVARAVLDYETRSFYPLTVRAANSSATEQDIRDDPTLAQVCTVKISVIDINEAPEIMQSQVKVAENLPAGSLVGARLTSADPDEGQTLSYTIVAQDGDHWSASARAFTITSAGQIMTTQILDYEANDLYELTVEVTDDASPPLSNRINVTVLVTDANEQPMANSPSFTVSEAAAPFSLVGRVEASDVDLGQNLTFTLTGAHQSTFQLDASSGQLRVAVPLDFEALDSYVVPFKVEDNGVPSMSGTGTITVTVNNVNEAPVVEQNQTRTVSEMASYGAIVGTPLLATDQDAGDLLTFTLVGGSGVNSFEIDPVTAQLTVANQTLDFETAPLLDLVVRATDSGGLFDDATVKIYVFDVNEAPSLSAVSYGVRSDAVEGELGFLFLSIFSFSFFFSSFPLFLPLYPPPRHPRKGSFVGAPLAYSDPDSNQGHTFAAMADATGLFLVDNTTGQMYVNNRATLAGLPTGYKESVRVRVKDDGLGELSDEIVVDVVVTSTNVAPVVSDAVFYVDEGSAAGTTVGAAISTMASDANVADTLTYSIVSGNSRGTFRMDPAFGQIYVRDPSELDYETASNFSLVVAVTDDGVGPMASAANITIIVRNVNENPSFDENAYTFSVREHSPAGTIVSAVINAFDPDNGTSLTFSFVSPSSLNDDDEYASGTKTLPVMLTQIIGNSASTRSYFAINPTTGVISLRHNVNVEEMLNYEKQKMHRAVVRVQDNGIEGARHARKSAEVLVTINVNNVNDAPSLPGEVFSLMEGTASGTPVGSLIASDEDAQDAITYTLTKIGCWEVVCPNTSSTSEYRTIGQNLAVFVASEEPDAEVPPNFAVTFDAISGGASHVLLWMSSAKLNAMEIAIGTDDNAKSRLRTCKRSAITESLTCTDVMITETPGILSAATPARAFSIHLNNGTLLVGTGGSAIAQRSADTRDCTLPSSCLSQNLFPVITGAQVRTEGRFYIGGWRTNVDLTRTMRNHWGMEAQWSTDLPSSLRSTYSNSIRYKKTRRRFLPYQWFGARVRVRYGDKAQMSLWIKFNGPVPSAPYGRDFGFKTHSRGYWDSGSTVNGRRVDQTFMTDPNVNIVAEQWVQITATYTYTSNANDLIIFIFDSILDSSFDISAVDFQVRLVKECTNPTQTCRLIDQRECFAQADGSDYRGSVNTTASGKTCAAWTAQSPHAHATYDTPETTPGKGLGSHNYCRNPDNSLRPWCYTTDPSTRREFCDVGSANEPCTRGDLVFLESHNVLNAPSEVAVSSANGVETTFTRVCFPAVDAATTAPDGPGRMFSVDAATGAIATSGTAIPDYEAERQHSFEVSATDSNGIAAKAIVRVDVQNVEEAPVFANLCPDNNYAACLSIPEDATKLTRPSQYKYSCADPSCGFAKQQKQIKEWLILGAPTEDPYDQYSGYLAAPRRNWCGVTETSPFIAGEGEETLSPVEGETTAEYTVAGQSLPTLTWSRVNKRRGCRAGCGGGRGRMAGSVSVSNLYFRTSGMMRAEQDMNKRKRSRNECNLAHATRCLLQPPLASTAQVPLQPQKKQRVHLRLCVPLVE